MTLPRHKWLPLLIMAVAILLVFGRTCSFEFVSWDDFDLIGKNKFVHTLEWRRFVGAWFYSFHRLYIPLTYNLWIILGAIGKAQTPDINGIKLNPWVFHTFNVLLHLCNTLLIYTLLKLFCKRPWLCVIGALAWAIHPLQVEAVAWATGMKDLLSGFFALLALNCHLHAAVRTPQQPSRLKPYILYTLAALSMLLATLAKPGVIGVPLMAIALDWLLVGRSLRTAILCAIPLILAVVPVMVITRIVQAESPFIHYPWWPRPLIAGHALAFYLQKIIWPAPLTIDYGLTPTAALQTRWVYFAWLIPFALTLAILWNKTCRKPLGAAWLIILAGVGPVLGLVHFDFQFFSTVTDRYMYLAMLGVALALTWALCRLPTAAALILGICLLVPLAGRSFAQTAYWENSSSLSLHAIKVNPRGVIGYTNLATAILVEGNALRAQANNVPPPQAAELLRAATQVEDQAEGILQQALTNDPDLVLAWNNLGTLYSIRGQPLKSLEFQEHALDAADRHPERYADSTEDRLKTGRKCLQMKLFDRAIGHFQKILQRHPDHLAAQQALRQAQAAMQSAATRPANLPGVNP